MKNSRFILATLATLVMSNANAFIHPTCILRYPVEDLTVDASMVPVFNQLKAKGYKLKSYQTQEELKTNDLFLSTGPEGFNKLECGEYLGCSYQGLLVGEILISKPDLALGKYVLVTKGRASSYLELSYIGSEEESTYRLEVETLKLWAQAAASVEECEKSSSTNH